MGENPKVYGIFYGLLCIQKPKVYVFLVLAFLVCSCRPPQKFLRRPTADCVTPSLIGKKSVGKLGVSEKIFGKIKKI